MRVAEILSFARRHVPADWSAQDIAEFYRVEAILVQSGLRVTSDRGVTDEGDPWFVFCRADDDEVIIHFARIGGRYVISAPAYCGNADGHDFRALVRAMIERHPILRPRPTEQNLYLHPAALLVMLVASAFLKAGHAAEAASTDANATPNGTHGAAADAAAAAKSRAAAPEVLPAPVTVTLDATRETLLLSAINAAMVASVPEHVMVVVPAAVAAASDALAPPAPNAATTAEAMLAEKSHGLPAGSSGMSPDAMPVANTALRPDGASHAGSHLLGPDDGAIAKLAATDVPHILPAPEAPPLPTMATGVAADPGAATQYVTFAALASISPADKALLQELGVPASVAYAPTAPDKIATLIHAGGHADAAVAPAAVAPVATTVVAPSTAAPPTDTTGVAPVTAVAPPASAQNAEPSPSGTPVAMAALLATVQQFEGIAVQPEVLLTTHGLIVYDQAAFNGNTKAVASYTFDLGDGFSVSLVGTTTELTHAHVPGYA